MNVKFSNEMPVVYPMLCTRFGGVKWEDSTDVITYGGTIYARHLPLPPDVVAHEMVHIRQQANYPDGLDAYVLRYCTDRNFRREQEVEAYKAQMFFIWQRTRDCNALARAKMQLAHDLATMYDLKISIGEALKLL